MHVYAGIILLFLSLDFSLINCVMITVIYGFFCTWYLFSRITGNVYTLCFFFSTDKTREWGPEDGSPLPYRAAQAPEVAETSRTGTR